MSKYAFIDILKLYSGTQAGFEDDFVAIAQGANHDSTRFHRALKSHDKWNIWLDECYRTNDLAALIDVRYRLQVGMSELVKKRLDHAQIHVMFSRWMGSIEKTAKRIIKSRMPIPKKSGPEALKAKRARDTEFEKFLIRSSF